MRLGIVGHGFVGSAVNQGFTKNVQKFIVDPKYFGSRIFWFQHILDPNYKVKQG